MRIRACGTTDIGRRRQRNEDAFLIDEELRLFIVCDGMGGHAAGDFASSTATDFIAEYFRTQQHLLRDAHGTPGGYFRIVEAAETATIGACRRLYELAHSHSQYAGMGTTMTMLIVVDDKAIMSHVGDSRLYLLRDGQLHLLSSDHTLANEMFQQGRLSNDDFAVSPYRNVLTRSVGNVGAVESELLLFDIIPGDTFLLCSDGLSNYIEDTDEIVAFLENDDLEAIPPSLVELANRRGGRDNITAVVARIAESETVVYDTQKTRIKTQALQSTFLCDGLPYSRLIRLVEIARLETFGPDALILRENDTCDGLYLIVDGRVSISRGDDELNELTRENVFCETALIQKRKAKATVKTLEPTTVLIVPSNLFQRFTRRFPKIGRILYTRLLEYLGSRFDESVASV